jgi:transposase
MDTSEQRTIETDTRVKRQRRSVEEKRQIVEETLGAGASVARVAQRHAINANQVFAWRKRYREGRLGKSSKLLPVTVSDIPERKCRRVGSTSVPSAVGTMEIKLPRGTVRIAGAVDVVALREVLECLAG